MPFNVELLAGSPPGEVVERLVGEDLPTSNSGVDDSLPMWFGIDPYSHTIFNQLQMQALVREIEALALRMTDYREQLGRVRRLAEMGSKRPHHYLVFLGD